MLSAALASQILVPSSIPSPLAQAAHVVAGMSHWAIFKNRACPKLISNPLRSSDDVTLSSCRKRDALSSKGVRASPAGALRIVHTFGHSRLGARYSAVAISSACC